MADNFGLILPVFLLGERSESGMFEGEE